MLASESPHSVPLPLIVELATQCYTIEWSLFKEADDVLITMPEVFTTDTDNLYVWHDFQDFQQRHALFGSDSYFFEGSLTYVLSDVKASTSSANPNPSTFIVTIEFLDLCQSAVLEPLTIDDFFVTWIKEPHATYTLPTIFDSVDLLENYESPVCGAKAFNFQAGSSPSFLSVVNDMQDSEGIPITIAYDQLTVTSADLRQHSIDY